MAAAEKESPMILVLFFWRGASVGHDLVVFQPAKGKTSMIIIISCMNSCD